MFRNCVEVVVFRLLEVLFEIIDLFFVWVSMVC